MIDVQVVLNGRGARAEELAVGVQSLLPSVRRLELAHTDGPVVRELGERFGGSVASLGSLRRGLPLLVSPARVAFAFGALRRVVSHTEVAGRCVTRVVLPGLGGSEHLACWSTSFLHLYEGSLDSLVDADLSFDREHLSLTSPTARSWMPAETVGVAMVGETGDDLARWSRRTGVALDAQQGWAHHVRGPAGGLRRRLVRRRHRRLVGSPGPSAR